MEPIAFHLRAASPTFRDLPWEYPLEHWEGRCSRLVKAPSGLSRHTVLFINYDGNLYALKELPKGFARKEHHRLSQAQTLRLPAVVPIGYIELNIPQSEASVLVTRYLERSLPYRSLFMSASIHRYRDPLLDAMAWLLAQLHLAGFYWGDCSLSNTLFHRDAGALQAYMVDAEYAELHKAGANSVSSLSPALRQQELDIMEENIARDLADLITTGLLADPFPLYDTGGYIRQRYHSLWKVVTREEIIQPNEHYRVQERIRELNSLGFSVHDIALTPLDQGRQVRFRPIVVDRNFHRDQLLELTGIEAEEMQAQKLMNEIQELKATLSAQTGQNMPLDVAAFHWLENIYKPTLQSLAPLIAHRQRKSMSEHPDLISDPAELYCQVLEHKWYLSERTHHDVGHQIAVNDYLNNIAKDLHRDEA